MTNESNLGKGAGNLLVFNISYAIMLLSNYLYAVSDI